MGKARLHILKFCCLLLAVGILGLGAADAAGRRFNMSFIYFGSSSDHSYYIDRAQNSLEEISPNYFNLSADGSLELTSAVSRSFVDEMHGKGLDVVPFLSNHWDRASGLAALQNRRELAGDIAGAVEKYDLDGVMVDLENLDERARSDYADFLKLLREAMPDKTLAVAVAANPWGAKTGWAGSYDYAGLAEYSDYLFIMAYDEHYNGSDAGAVAGLSFIERSVKYALSVVAKDKLVLGLPFYGRIWSDGGGYPDGYGISNARVQELISAYGGSCVYDAISGAARATITVDARDAKPAVGGTALAAGTYTIWYGDERTIKSTLDLVDKYDLKGAGSWSLGGETDGTWDYYTLRLNGCRFGDVEGHWASDDILTAYLNGWVKGCSDTVYNPDGSLTRAQAVTMLDRLLGLDIKSYDAYGFDDTRGHWAGAAIETARKYGVVNGVSDSLFDPDGTVTREQMAVMLGNILGLDASGCSGGAFGDVSESANPWSCGAIKALGAYGIFEGCGDGLFHPADALTRAQAAALLTRAGGYVNP